MVLTYENRGEIYIPEVEEGAQLVAYRDGTASEFTATILTDHVIDPGDVVTVKDYFWNDKGFDVFYGYVFTTEHGKNPHEVTITCYDQLRYLKNKDTYVFSNTTLRTRVTRILDDYNLTYKNGITTNSYKIQPSIYENQTLLDMIQDSISQVLLYTGKQYVLFDDHGTIALVDLEADYFDSKLMYELSSMEDYSMKSTIDDDTYNSVIINYKDEDRGVIRIAGSASDQKSIQRYGLLRTSETTDDPDYAQDRADMLLQLYNRVKRTLTLSGVPCNSACFIRPGHRIYCKMNLGDNMQDGYLIVNQCTTTWNNYERVMDLVMEGGIYDAE